VPQIQATHFYSTRSSGDSAFERAPGASHPAGAAAAHGAGPATHRQSHIGEIDSIIQRFEHDEAAGAEARERYGSMTLGSQVLSREIAMGGILYQMRAILSTERASEWKPLPSIGEALCVLARYLQDATEPEKGVMRARLAEIVAKAGPSHRRKDMAMLGTIIDRTLKGEDPMEALARRAEASLKPPHAIRFEGADEPSQFDFEYTLLGFANATYSYGPLGRSLILEGARHCFAGPSQARRAAILRDVIFALPDPPQPGAPLANVANIFLALQDRGLLRPAPRID
jgi:hypothetical protein